MEQKYQQIKEQLLSFMEKENTTEEEFNQMALTVFGYQYESNRPFRKYCRKRRVTPRNVSHYTEIPPVPIEAFKTATLSSHPIEEVEAVFMTSGTTDPRKRGKNFHPDLEVYDVSVKRHFKPFVLPDREKIKMFVMFPTEEEMPNSSLAHYLRVVKDTFGTQDSQYVLTKDNFPIEYFIQSIQKAEKDDEPILLIGATFSFIHLLDECKQRDIHFELPRGSRIMDTGGAKGRSREMAPDEFRQEMISLFSIPASMNVNMYGMTELSSQIYDQTLFSAYHNQPESSAKKEPHWVRTVVVDAEHLKRKERGEPGIIVHYDLANLNSAMAILTEDKGIEEADGFQLLGRAQGTEARGCSLAMEQFLKTNREDDNQ